jgi:quaternary ammonium compound-resistance protein SugE
MEKNMAWVLLFLAGLLEIIWAYAMKQSHGFSRFLPTFVMAVAMIGSFGLLAVSMRSLPLGTAYMIWTGIGAIGAFCRRCLGTWRSDHPATPDRGTADRRRYGDDETVLIKPTATKRPDRRGLPLDPFAHVIKIAAGLGRLSGR